MIAIIDYGVGNLFSLARSFASIGAEVEITSNPEKICAADKILLPGVGAFGDAADKLRSTGLNQIVVQQAQAGKPLLGICLGMQLLFEQSLEYGSHKGLGLIPGRVIPIQQVIPQGLKIPHMGWNALDFQQESPLLSKIKDGDFVYFVHSYCAVDCEDSVIATADYGAPVTAAVQKNNVFGCQFHPEKSGTVGLNILRSFAEMEG